MKVICVTGVTSGFGQAIARRFVRDGIRVVGLGRRAEKLSALHQELGDLFLPMKADVRFREEVARVFQALPPLFAEIDVLVNNAGLGLGLEPAHQCSIEDWELMVQTNINGVMNCTHSVLPGMVKRNRGHVINIGSIAAEVPYPGGNVYGATKAFVKQFSLNLKADLLGTAVRVTDIEPGLCGDTEFSQVRFKQDLERAKKVYEGTEPLLPEDIAETVAWVAALPPRVNINSISMMPVCQSFGPTVVSRK